PAVDGVAHRELPPRGSEPFWNEMAWHAPGNLTGAPSLCVPIPATSPPASLQVLGRPGDDAAVIAAARAVERTLARRIG
ncbi:MAG: hypothetical protein J7513_11860, partial [Solirubrobacteraceae bacterium]|nr:hypothetical protein [Solirubrobacteraceae bacterium]